MNAGDAESNYGERKEDNIMVADTEVKQADEYLTDAYKLAFACGPTYLAHDASLAITMLNIIKVYINRAEYSDITEMCAYYLGE